MRPKEEKRLRVGVLGAGPIAQFAHLEATRKARNAELVAICDAATDLLERMAAVHQPQRVYTDYGALLADPEIDAVVVAVSDQYHVALARQALEAGKHVLVEKPLGVSIEECKTLRQAAAAKGCLLQVGNNRRFDPGIAFARTFVHEQIGQVMAIKAWYYDSFYRYTMTDNLQPIPLASAAALRPHGNPKADKQRYFMLTHGSHLVDTARYLAGELVQVQSCFIHRFHAYGWFVAVDFASGALGHLDLIVPIQGDFEEGFQVFGEKGSVTARGSLPWYHKASHVECFSAADRQYHRVLGEDAYTYKLQIEGFADTILHGQPQQGATLEDGIAAMRAMVAIARSVERGQPVALADVEGGV